MNSKERFHLIKLTFFLLFQFFKSYTLIEWALSRGLSQFSTPLFKKENWEIFPPLEFKADCWQIFVREFRRVWLLRRSEAKVAVSLSQLCTITKKHCEEWAKTNVPNQLFPSIIPRVTKRLHFAEFITEKGFQIYLVTNIKLRRVIITVMISEHMCNVQIRSFYSFEIILLAFSRYWSWNFKSLSIIRINDIAVWFSQVIRFLKCNVTIKWKMSKNWSLLFNFFHQLF